MSMSTMASIPRIDMCGFGGDAASNSCFRPPDHPALIVNNYDLQYKQEAINNCFICKRSIYLNTEATVDIYSNYTTTSKSLVADAITNLILSEIPHITFPNTTICMHCYSMIDRADCLHHEFIEIKSAMKEKMANIIAQQWPHEPPEPIPVVKEPEPVNDTTSIETDMGNTSTQEGAQTLLTGWKIKRQISAEICVPGLTFLPCEDSEEYVCLFCFRKYKEKTMLAQHFDRQHGRKAKVECKICNTDISGGLKYFMQHMKIRHSVKDLRDGMGELKVKDSMLLNLNGQKDNVCESLKNRKVNCVKCNLSMSETVFNDHVLSVHFKSRCKRCDVCNVDVKSSRFRYHMLERHGIGTPYTCPSCPETFTKSHTLKIHRERIHGVQRPPEKLDVQCPKCPRKFSKPSVMKLHLRSTHENQRPNVCHICGASYKMKSTLNVHLRKHTGIRPYMCEICSKTFNAVTDCRRHIRKVHKIQFKVRYNDALHPYTLPIKVLTQEQFEK